MELREGKAALSQVKVIEQMIKAKLLQAEALKASLELRAIRYDGDKVQTMAADQMAEVFAKIDELNNEVNDLIKEKQKAILETSAFIDQLEDATERMVLTAFYVSGQSARRIAREMQYSRRGVYKIMERGIAKL